MAGRGGRRYQLQRNRRTTMSIRENVTQERINKIVRAHRAWLDGESAGERANLRRANLCDANLRRANLCRANLCDADLRRANLCGADLGRANLCGANL
ncbi:hypothetical protein C1141_20410, partial [Vibrio agarivorans]